MSHVPFSSGHTTAPSSDPSYIEYEYSSSQTQSYYITLDLSSHTTHNNNNHGGRRKSKRQKLTDSTSAITTRSRANEVVQTAAEPGDETVNEAGFQTEAEQGAATAPETANEDALPDQGEEDNQPSASSRVQIMDLASSNPLVSYQGTIYSCSWSTPLGTDILLTKPRSSVSASYLNGSRTANGIHVSEATDFSGLGSKPWAAEGGGPVLAFSDIRLTAKPLKAMPLNDENASPKRRGRPPRQKVVDTVDNGGDDELNEVNQDLQAAAGAHPQHSTASPTSDSPVFASRVSTEPTFQPQVPSSAPGPSEPSLLETALLPHSSQARRAQASFLERLMVAKKNLGETDSVTVYAAKTNSGTGWRSQAKQAVIEGAQQARSLGNGGESNPLEIDEGGANTEEENEVQEQPGLQSSSRKYQARKIREATRRVAPREGYTPRGRRGRRSGRAAGTARVHWLVEEGEEEGEGSRTRTGSSTRPVTTVGPLQYQHTPASSTSVDRAGEANVTESGVEPARSR